MKVDTNPVVVGYIVFRAVHWPATVVDAAGREIPFAIPEGQVGYLPIYKTVEALKAEWGEDILWVPLYRGAGEP